MIREDLVSSAVSFLQDPSVAAAPVAKRIAFLQSKNLTQEEIDTSLARAGEGTSLSSTAAPPIPDESRYTYTNQQTARQRPSYGYEPYQGGPWSLPPPPPEPPRRDWRDWFIMATVTSGVGYGLYVVAKRYVLPIISPPTPPQLESDKAAIDESFARAFALIDQLASDTESLKNAEVERNEKLDMALRDVESVVSDLKAANTRREDEARIIAEQVRNLQTMIPKALDSWKQDGDSKLVDLGTEMKSLKKLLSNRLGGSAGAQLPSGRSSSSILADKEKSNGDGSSYQRESGTVADEQEQTSGYTAPAPGVTAPKRESSSGYTLDSKRSGRAAIPAWQMAAANIQSKSAIPAPISNGEGSAETSA